MFRYFFISIFLFNFLYSNSSLVIKNNKFNYDEFQISYFKDDTSSLTIEDVVKLNFASKNSNKFNLGYIKGNIWFKLKVENKSKNKDFIISLGETFYEIANLYYYDNQLNLIKKQNSIFKKIKDRGVKTNHLSFDVNIPKNQTKTFYIQIQGKYAYFGKISIFNKEYLYYQNLLDMNSIFLVIFGILFLIIIFNLFLYIRLKEKIYIYYVGYSFFNLIYMLNISGLLVFVNLQNYIYDLQLAAGFMLGFLVLFSFEYLDTKKYLNKYDKFLKSLSIPFFILGVLVVFSYQPWNKLINNFAGLLCIILILVSSIVYFKGHNKTKYYIFAMLLYFSSVVFFTFMVVGIFEYNNFTRYGFIISSAIEAIIFSLMLSDRYNELKEEIIVSQNKLLAVKEENEKLLEMEVKKRTSELRERYLQIKNLLGEREMLLKEVHHRVKNNFHTIMGLLWFEGQKNIKEKEKFQNLRNRIKSMSMIHERLYKADDISKIPTKEYIEDIINNCSSSYSGIKTKLNYDIENIFIEFDHALSLGVIVNEILNNSLKHNTNLENLELEVKIFTKKGKIFLFIKDNGKGFDVDLPADGLGISIINNFAKKLPSSNYKYTILDGVIFELSFNKG